MDKDYLLFKYIYSLERRGSMFELRQDFIEEIFS